MGCCKWWLGRRGGKRLVFEQGIKAVQCAAGDMLIHWHGRWRSMKKTVQYREDNRGRMGAVWWAWRVVTWRNMGMWEHSTRVAAEWGGRGDSMGWIGSRQVRQWNGWKGGGRRLLGEWAAGCIVMRDGRQRYGFMHGGSGRHGECARRGRWRGVGMWSG